MTDTGITGLASATLARALLLRAAMPAAAQNSLQPAGWDDQVRLREAVDVNDDPRIVEVTLEARVNTVTIAPGVDVDAWTYNGTMPGPLIRTQAGDRVIVHYANNLPRPSTVHWHGIRVPIEMDSVPGYSQRPVAV
jgi:FtsP/CotA-like multicopper oxidase with cupredoxin domain